MKNLKRTGLKELYYIVLQDIKTSPKFTKDRKIKETLNLLSGFLTNLIDVKFKNDKDMFCFIEEFNELAEDLELIMDIKLYLNCIDYFVNLIDKWINDAEYHEEYESLSNLQKFKQHLKIKEFV